MDEDLATLSREQLIEEVRKLRRGIRAHRDSTGQDLCWHHPALWGLLPEKQDPLPQVPDWADFTRGCVQVPPVARQGGAERLTSSVGDRVRPAGLEPATHSLEGCCSIHLSYGR